MFNWLCFHKQTKLECFRLIVFGIILFVVLPEEGGDVVVLEDGLVVVHDGEVGAGLDVEVVGGAGVVVVVDDGGEEEGEDLKIWEPRLGRE